MSDHELMSLLLEFAKKIIEICQAADSVDQVNPISADILKECTNTVNKWKQDTEDTETQPTMKTSSTKPPRPKQEPKTGNDGQPHGKKKRESESSKEMPVPKKTKSDNVSPRQREHSGQQKFQPQETQEKPHPNQRTGTTQQVPEKAPIPQESQKTPKRWTEEEMDILYGLYKAHHDPEEMTHYLPGRSTNAIRNKLKKVGKDEEIAFSLRVELDDDHEATSIGEDQGDDTDFTFEGEGDDDEEEDFENHEEEEIEENDISKKRPNRGFYQEDDTDSD